MVKMQPTGLQRGLGNGIMKGKLCGVAKYIRRRPYGYKSRERLRERGVIEKEKWHPEIFLTVHPCSHHSTH
jgi:hypothetical protein